MNIKQAFQTLMRQFRAQPVEDHCRRIEPTSGGQAKVYFRHYGTWVHADTMSYTEAMKLPPSWYAYQKREYELSRC